MLAARLGKFVSEIQAMDHREYMHWHVHLGRVRQKREIAAKMGR